MFANKRLDRIEAAIEALTGQQAELRSSVAGLKQAVDRVVFMFERLLPEIKEMQSEVRGLQTENRRILDRLFPSPPPE